MLVKMFKMEPTLIWHSPLLDWLPRWFFQWFCSVSCVCVKRELWHKKRVFVGGDPGWVGTNLVMNKRNKYLLGCVCVCVYVCALDLSSVWTFTYSMENCFLMRYVCSIPVQCSLTLFKSQSILIVIKASLYVAVKSRKYSLDPFNCLPHIWTLSIRAA